MSMKAILKIEKAGFKVVAVTTLRNGKYVTKGYNAMLYNRTVLHDTSAVSLLRRLKIRYPSYFYKDESVGIFSDR